MIGITSILASLKVVHSLGCRIAESGMMTCHIFFTYSDFNECDTGNVTCHENAECYNTEGSYQCICRLGFTGDGLINCTGKNLLVAAVYSS